MRNNTGGGKKLTGRMLQIYLICMLATLCATEDEDRAEWATPGFYVLFHVCCCGRNRASVGKKIPNHTNKVMFLNHSVVLDSLSGIYDFGFKVKFLIEHSALLFALSATRERKNEQTRRVFLQSHLSSPGDCRRHRGCCVHSADAEPHHAPCARL